MNDTRVDCYHEAGHAIVGQCLAHPTRSTSVMIIPRGGTGGVPAVLAARR